jgi:NAD-dependent deacetylase
MKIDDLVKRIKDSKSIVFFTGAGVSTESGIPDFRSSKGLYKEKYNGYNPEYILSHDFFFEHTDIFYKFYFDNIVHIDAKPNGFHKNITKLEKMGYDVSVITQNIDNLHNKAGNSAVYELHGSINRNYCTSCRKFFDVDYMIKNVNNIVKCDYCNGLVKPDVVLYEEQLDETVIENSISKILNADVMVVAGTSLSVYPAASFIDFYNKDCLCIINKTTTLHDDRADYVFYDSCSVVLEKIISKLGNNL